jgi:hypothetical protein
MYITAAGQEEREKLKAEMLKWERETTNAKPETLRQTPQEGEK